MLGHRRSQGYSDNVFKMVTRTLVPEVKVAPVLVRYCFRYPVLGKVASVFEGDNLFKFLFLFGGISLKVPETGYSELDEEMSFLPEVLSEFGEGPHRELIRLFHGQILRIPPLERLRASIRDVDIYCLLQDVASEEREQTLTNRASKYYNVSVSDVRSSVRRVQDVLGSSQPPLDTDE